MLTCFLTLSSLVAIDGLPSEMAVRCCFAELIQIDDVCAVERAYNPTGTKVSFRPGAVYDDTGTPTKHGKEVIDRVQRIADRWWIGTLFFHQCEDEEDTSEQPDNG